MKRLIYIVLLSLLVFPIFGSQAQEDEQAAKTAPTATAAQEEPAQDADGQQAEKQPASEEDAEDTQKPAAASAIKDASQNDDYFDEGLFNDEEGATGKTTSTAGKTGAEQEENEGFIPRKITIDAVVIVNYSFADTGESYNVKYHINMGGKVVADIGIIKGNAKVATDIGGFLAKTSAFECLLKVSIADVPYEIAFKKVSDTEADINVSFKDQILEDWESMCTFLDTSSAKFNTRGAPERWIGVALEKASPPLSRLTTPIDPVKTTTLKFSVPKQSVPEESLGTAQIEATGVVTIQPERAPKERPENVLEE